MKKNTLLLLVAAVVGLVAWRQSQAASSSSSPAAADAGLSPFGIGDAAFPGIIGDPYLRAAAAGEAAGAPSSSLLGGKLDWGFLTAVANSNALNRIRGRDLPGGITADHLGASFAAPSSSSSSSGGYTGGGGGGGGGGFAKGGGQVQVF